MEILPTNEAVGEGETAEENDIIPSLLNEAPYKVRPDNEKLSIIQKGRPIPKLYIVKRDSSRNCNRTFQESWYSIHKWLCGSKQYNKLFCWPCTLMRPESSSWCSTGNDDVKRLSSMASKHATCKSHLKATTEYDAILVGFGFLPEFANETKSENKEVQDSVQDSESEDFFDLYFTDDQKLKRNEKSANDNATNLLPNSNEGTQKILEKPIGAHISFKAWQELNRQSHPFSRSISAEDRKLFKWRKKIAKQELKNARLTEHKIKIEIELLKAKLDQMKSLEAPKNITETETSIRMPLIVPVETIDSSNIENTLN